MRYKIDKNFLEVYLNKGESFYSKPNTISFLSENLEVKNYITSFDSMVLRAFVGGEIFFNEIYAKDKGRALINKDIGHILDLSLKNKEIFIGTSYLAHYGDLEISSFIKLSNLLPLFKVSGRGKLFLYSISNYKKVRVNGKATVKSSSLLALDGNFEINRIILGEGLAKITSSREFYFDVKGKGDIYIGSSSLEL